VDRPGALDLTATRTGDTIQLHQAGEPYAVRLPYTWSDGAVEHSGILELDGATTLWPLPLQARRVAFDPDFHLFRRLHREEIPASLNQTLGATSTVAVVGADATPAVAEALRELATGWAERPEVAWIDEGDDLPGDAARFLLGDGPLARAALAIAAEVDPTVEEIAARARDRGWSLVVCTRDPDDAEVGWTVVLPADAGVVSALGRKLPHYGRYGWLLFDGETNAGKGSWRPRTSPLTLDLEDPR